MIKNNKFYSLLLMFSFFLFFFGCSEHESEPNLEENIDVWLENNKGQLQELDRKTITSFPVEYQKAIMRELEPQKRKDIWRDKVQHILSLDLSKEELEYLSWFKITLDGINYDKRNYVELDSMMYENLIAGMKKFNWSKNFVHQMFFSIEDVVENGKVFQDPNPPSCNCYYDLGCPNWDCDESQGACDTEDPNDDCGIMGNSDCTGYC